MAGGSGCLGESPPTAGKSFRGDIATKKKHKIPNWNHWAELLYNRIDDGGHLSVLSLFYAPT